MRYFYQNKTYVKNFDEETQVVVETVENNITWSWNVITPENIVYDVVERYDEEGHLIGKAKYVDVEQSTPEVGKWVYSSAEDYPSNDKEAPSVINAHDKDIKEVEKVSIIRDLTEEEIAERQREKERQEQEQQEAQERAEQLDNYIKTDNNEITLNSDVPNAATGGGPFIKVDNKGVYASKAPADANGEEVATAEWVRELIAQELKKVK